MREFYSQRNLYLPEAYSKSNELELLVMCVQDRSSENSTRIEVLPLG